MFECSFDWNVHLSMSDSSRRRAELMCCARSRRVVLRVPDHFNGIALFMTRKHLYLAIIVATISQLTKTVTNFGSSWTGLSFTLRSARNILMSPHTHTHTHRGCASARSHTHRCSNHFKHGSQAREACDNYNNRTSDISSWIYDVHNLAATRVRALYSRWHTRLVENCRW